MAKNIHSYERRRHTRYGVGSLVVTIKRQGLWQQILPPIEATALDFNQYGLSLRCKSKLKDGETVLLNLISRQDDIEQLPALVCHIVKAGSQYRYGLKFDLSTQPSSSKSTIEGALTALEFELKQTKIVST